MVPDYGPTEEELASVSKKVRVVRVLISARSNNQWVSIRDLKGIGSEQYIHRLLRGFEDSGHVNKRWTRGKDGRKRGMWQATDSADGLLTNLLRNLTNLEGGRLPRGSRQATRRGLPQHRIIDVEPVSTIRHVDASRAWLEKEEVWIRMDPAVARKLRTVMNPLGPEDRAEQYSLTSESFSLSINNKDLAQVVLTKTQWSLSLTELCLSCGVSNTSTLNLIAEVSAYLPEGLMQVEIPLLLPELKRLNVHFEIDTQLLYKGKPTDYGIHSNINYSTNIDLEITGVALRVGHFVSMLGTMQHDADIAQQTLRLREIAEAEEREQQKVKAEKELKKRIAEEERKKDDRSTDYIVWVSTWKRASTKAP